ncbi:MULTISPECIES: formate dehydrogenase accessory sulfurtransferase FdhD [Paenibacillus]|uniref:Sulfur carrier protein FdhD n=1 Tax=Paenibacillus naphthalenovorans TaxID=162209 RepID=A0A0U2WAJ0_9BACL|nr:MULTISPECIES: formate dehydrogenase accessory sulfurtransferase FdhD [Paenibacillus]ALS24461.1 formate dehydrogenase [Paenibacillus naphthalenovorans]NTZ20567.1 formate dehydrogenase accessory sulfurtransferase FdhD [Paenibacillus sp. JMULE4]SDJ13209.1 FdhD protein [Paenibacillus naphthalenovorans]
MTAVDVSVSTRTVWRYDGQLLSEQEDPIAKETPLTIRLDGEEFATIVCTPSDIEDMVFGFLASEGVIREANEVTRLQLNTSRGFADVTLLYPERGKVMDHSKRVIGSCCGKSRQFYLRSDVRTAKTVMTRSRITPDECLKLIRQLQEGSDVFRQTGGVHNAALCSREKLLVTRTDIGRHNALDKVYGHCLRERVSMKDTAVAFSGRVSSEVLLKTAKMGVGILLSKSAPTDLALELADDLGITVIGFIRGNTFNVYSHPERLE